ncbi:Hypothetical protein POVR1_LOCUS254 [uncultured virus]|nr:Hypothetical protein POVR1_LOCUS254 [uncultured virus]
MNTISTTSPTTATSTRSAQKWSSFHEENLLILSAKEAMGSRNSRRPIIHPIFEQAAVAYTKDVFWIKNLMMSARGMYPKGFIYNDGCLRYTKKTKITPTYIRISDNPMDVACDYIEFIKKCDKLYSDSDIAYNQQCQKLIIETESKELTWATASKKMKRSLVYYYADKQAESKNLTKEQKANLIHTIFFGMDLKVFNNDTVRMTKDEITEIIGLICDETTMIYSLKLPPAKLLNLGYEKTSKSTTMKENQLNVMTRWKVVADRFDMMEADKQSPSETKRVGES